MQDLAASGWMPPRGILANGVGGVGLMARSVLPSAAARSALRRLRTVTGAANVRRRQAEAKACLVANGLFNREATAVELQSLGEYRVDLA